MSEDVEALRAFYREQVARSSARAVARAAGLNHATLTLFVSGGSKRPTGDVLTRMRAYRERASQAQSDTAVSDGERGMAGDPSYWAGYLAATNEMLAHAHAMIGQANQQIGTMLTHQAAWLKAPGVTAPSAEQLADAAHAAAEADAGHGLTVAPAATTPAAAAPAPRVAPRRRGAA